MNQPDQVGRFGEYGGRYVPETLMPLMEELAKEYARAKEDPVFQQEFRRLLREYVGRPSLLYHAIRLTQQLGGAQIYLKREDLNHTGAHKINNTIGQALLARRMGKRRIIAETGAGQHGVATATVCALFNLQGVVYMGQEDIRRQALNVFRMRLLGTEVVPVTSGSQTLKDAINEAFRDWVTNVHNTYYMFGTAAGPHPFPEMVRDFHAVIGEEIRSQTQEICGKLPDYVVACVGGGSNAIGAFHAMLDEPTVQLVGVEAAGRGLNSGAHAASLTAGSKGVLHGALTYLLQDSDGQVQPTHSVSAGLDYPGVGPQHAFLKDSGRVQYVGITDTEALDAFRVLAQSEGIIPALESAHALAYAATLAPTLSADQIIVVNLSGRGDKDVQQIAEMEGMA